MEYSNPKAALLRDRLRELTAQGKKLCEENRHLRADIRNLLDVQSRLRLNLLGNVTNKEICFSASGDREEPLMVQQTVTAISRALIEAQEQERARIARDLHDDINQRLALLTLGIDQVREDVSSASASEIDRRMRELKEQAIGIGADVHAIAHHLHPSALQYLGLLPAVKRFAEEMGQRHGIQIEIKNDGATKALPAEISLCLFRIVQEGLHNAARHSGTKRIEVHLQKTDDQVHLTLTDSGNGFDVATITKGQGLGLASMRERIRLVKGKIVIHSERAVGTCIQAWVPVQANAA
jgi:signal transduction histidine kinase